MGLLKDMDKRLLGIMVIGFLLMGFMFFNQTPELKEDDAAAESAYVFGRLRTNADQGQRGFDNFQQRDPRDRNRAELTTLAEQMKENLSELQGRNDEYNMKFNKSHASYDLLNIRMNGTLNQIYQALRLIPDESDTDKEMRRAYQKEVRFVAPDAIPVTNVYNIHAPTTTHAPVNIREGDTWAGGTSSYVGPTSSYTGPTTVQGARTMVEGAKSVVYSDSRASTNIDSHAKSLEMRRGDVSNFSAIDNRKRSDVQMTRGDAIANYESFTQPVPTNTLDPTPVVDKGRNAALVLTSAAQAHKPQLPVSGGALARAKDLPGTDALLAPKPTVRAADTSAKPIIVADPTRNPKLRKPSLIPPILLEVEKPVAPGTFTSITVPPLKPNDPLDDVHSQKALVPPELSAQLKGGKRGRSTSITEMPTSLDLTAIRAVKKPFKKVVITEERSNTQIALPKNPDTTNLDPMSDLTPDPVTTKRTRAEPSMDQTKMVPQQRRGKRPKVSNPALEKYIAELNNKKAIVQVIGERLSSTKTPTAAQKEEFKKRYFDLAYTVPPVIVILPPGKSSKTIETKTQKFFTQVTDKKDIKIDETKLGSETVKTLVELLKHYGTSYEEVAKNSPEYEAWRNALMDVHDLRSRFITRADR